MNLEHALGGLGGISPEDYHDLGQAQQLPLEALKNKLLDEVRQLQILQCAVRQHWSRFAKFRVAYEERDMLRQMNDLIAAHQIRRQIEANRTRSPSKKRKNKGD
jgi:L-rhamnose isomerase